MFVGTIPFATSYGDRLVLIKAANFHRVKVIEKTPRFTLTDFSSSREKPLYLEMLRALGKYPGAFSHSSVETLQRRCAEALSAHASAGVILKDAQLLFKGSSKRQINLVGSSVLFEYYEVFRTEEKKNKDLDWDSARIELVTGLDVDYFCPKD